MTKFIIEANNEVVLCEFEEDVSPITCAAIKGLLPYKAPASFAKTAGDEMFIPVPLKNALSGEGKRILECVKPGSIVLWPNRCTVCFFHSQPQFAEEGKVVPVGHVIENLDGFGRILMAVREKQGIEIFLHEA